MFAGEHTNKNDYIRDYEEIKEILTKKYGKPKDEIVSGENGMHRRTSWETSTTEIDLTLSPSYTLYNQEIETSLVISYDSKKLKEWVKQAKEKEASKDF